MKRRDKITLKAKMRWIGRERLPRHFSSHCGRLAARSNAPAIDMMESQRQGNCTDWSRGIADHKGRLSAVAIRKENANRIARAFKWRVSFFEPRARLMSASAGRKNPIIASASRFAYQVFRFSSEAGEKRKLTL